MRVAARILFRLAAFLGVTGLVYVLTSHERAGGSMILVGAVAFTYLGLILRGAAQRGEGHETAPIAVAAPEPEDEGHVGPTLWPFVFSVAAVGFVLGLVLARWLLVAGGVMFVVSTIGWFVDIRRQHAHSHRA